MGVDSSVPVLQFAYRTGAGDRHTEGRKAEFAGHGWDAEDIPDPQDPQTFLRSKLDWDQVGAPEHADLLAFYGT